MSAKFVIRLREVKVRKFLAPPGTAHTETRRALKEKADKLDAEEEVLEETTAYKDQKNTSPSK